MTCIATICIYNNLTACKTGITMWSTDYKAACRINKEFCVFVNHLCRKHRIKYILFNICMNLLLCHIRIMLCRKYNCFQSERLTIFIIFYRNLALSIRTKIF